MICTSYLLPLISGCPTQREIRVNNFASPRRTSSRLPAVRQDSYLRCLNLKFNLISLPSCCPAIACLYILCFVNMAHSSIAAGRSTNMVHMWANHWPALISVWPAECLLEVCGLSHGTSLIISTCLTVPLRCEGQPYLLESLQEWVS